MEALCWEGGRRVTRNATLVLGPFILRPELSSGQWSGQRLRFSTETRTVPGILTAAALHVEDVIGGNAVEPGAELTLALERPEFGDDLDEYLLRDLLGVLSVAPAPLISGRCPGVHGGQSLSPWSVRGTGNRHAVT